MKQYIKPVMTVVKMQPMSIICYSQYGSTVNSNAGLQGGGTDGSIIGSYNSARSREAGDIWDEEW